MTEDQVKTLTQASDLKENLAALDKELNNGTSWASFAVDVNEEDQPTYIEVEAAFNRGGLDKALEQMKALVEKTALTQEAWIGYGNCLGKLNRFEEAFGAFAIAAMLCPADPLARFFIGGCLIHLARIEDAKDSIGHCIELAAKDPERHLMVLKSCKELLQDLAGSE